MNIWHPLHHGLSELLRFIFPPICPGCGKGDCFLCAACEKSVTPTRVQVNESTVALFPYRSPVVKRMLWLLKYHGKRHIATLFAGYLFSAIIEDAPLKFFKHEFLVVPMPMSKKNQARRGWNHAALIAQDLAHKIGGQAHYTENVLLKIKETRRQATIKKRSLRLKNLSGSMRASHVDGKNILLIDDVTTTGASISEATRALKAAGARDVRAYLIAH